MNNELCPMCSKHHDQDRPCYSPKPLPPVRVQQVVRRLELRALEALVAHALRPELNPPTESEIDQFIREYDEGKHPLSPEDEAALERAHGEFVRKLHAIYAKPPNGDISERGSLT